jgi:hypothetical protein
MKVHFSKLLLFTLLSSLSLGVTSAAAEEEYELTTTSVEWDDFELDVYHSGDYQTAASEYHTWSSTIELSLFYWGSEDVELTYSSSCFYQVQILSADPRETDDYEILVDSMDLEECEDTQSTQEFTYNDYISSHTFLYDPEVFSARPGEYFLYAQSLHTNTDEVTINSEVIAFETWGEVWLGSAMLTDDFDCSPWNGSEYTDTCVLTDQDLITIEWDLTNGTPLPERHYEAEYESCPLHLNFESTETYTKHFSENLEMDCDALEIDLAPEDFTSGSASFDMSSIAGELPSGDYYLTTSFSKDNNVISSSAVGIVTIHEVFDVNLLPDTKGHWAQYYIEDLFTKEIISGYENGNYGPEDSVTNAEFAKMLSEALPDLIDFNTYDESWNHFPNLDASHWAHDYIEMLYGSSVGLSGEISPDEAITRGEVVTTLITVLKQDSWFLEEEDYIFTDLIDEEENYAAHVSYHLGLVSGYQDEAGELTGLFGPSDSLTRAQAAKVITLAMEWYEENSYSFYSY